MSSSSRFRDDRYVKVGDVVLLEVGKRVQCADCPSYFDEHASPYAQGTFDCLVEINVPLQRKMGIDTIRNAISDQIKGLFEYYNVPLDQGILKRFVANQVPEPQSCSFMVPAGLYQITDIEMRPRHQKIMLSSYRPAPGAGLYHVYVLQGGFHQTHADCLRVVIDPDNSNQV